jgi:hypothetical protein
MISFVQILAIVFGLFAFSRAFLRWKEGKIKLAELLFWGGIWVLAIIFGIFPQTLGLFSEIVGFGRGLDFILSISIIVMFYLIFRLYVKLDENEQNVTRLVREIALKGKK